jgi:[lysine-biosynthesis-protein LysW]--L-2-aminoadipate ligase
MLLKKHGVPTPDATVAFSKDAAIEALDIQGYPKVIKPTVGSWGRLISKLNDKDSADGIIESREKMYPIYQVHYLEEFVQRPPRDIRAIMVGDKIVAAIYRTSLRQFTELPVMEIGKQTWPWEELQPHAQSPKRWRRCALKQKMPYKAK